MMNQIINRLKYWGQLLLLPIYWLSFLVPRNKNIWLFGSTFGRRFADNPRYLYLYVSQHSDKSSKMIKNSIREWKEQGHPFTEDPNCKDIRAVWISHSREIVGFLNRNGYESYYYHSLRGIWLALRAKVYFFDNYSKDINFWQSGGAVKVNLWHGVGNKKINYDNVYDQVRHPQTVWEKVKYFPRRLSDEKPSHYIVSTSPVMSKIFSRAFQVNCSHVLETGYPRNAYIMGADIQNIYLPEEQKALEIIRQWKSDGGQIDFYVPTFRESEQKLLTIMNIKKLSGFLKENNMLLITKFHPKSKLRDGFAGDTDDYIINLDPNMDPYVFLKEVDVLTTDYSSIYSDFMLLDRPVVAFQYDFEEYSDQTREAYFDFKEYMPEKTVMTLEELMRQTKNVLGEDTAREKRAVSRQRMFGSNQKEATANLVSQVCLIIKK